MKAKAAVARLRAFGTRLVGARGLRSPFGRNVAILSLGTALAQAIPILISPILTRLYSPEDFGVLALYSASVGLLAVVASGRYELAIMLPDKDEDADALVVLSVFLAICISLVSLAAILVFEDSLAGLAGENAHRLWMYAVPLGIFFTATYSALNYWLNRHKRYWVMARNRVVQTGSGGALGILLGFIGFRPYGLIAGPLLGQLITTATIAASFVKRHTLSGTARQMASRSIGLARRYLHHPMHLLPSQLLTAASMQLPILAVSVVYGVAAAGFFMLAIRTVSVPVSVVAAAIGDVYRQEAAIRHRKHGQFRTAYLKVTITNAALGIIPFTALFLFSPILFQFVFGDAWADAGEIASIFAIAGYLQFVFTPVDKGAVIVGATKYILMWCVLRFVLTFSLVVTSFFIELDLYNFVFALVLINCAMYIIDGYVEYVLSCGPTRNLWIPRPATAPIVREIDDV